MLALDRSLPSVLADLERVQARFPALRLEGFKERVEAGTVQVFPLAKATIVTEVDVHGVAHVLAAAGELADVMAFEPELRAWHAARGAWRMTLRGRPGWRRVLGARGWRPSGGPDNELAVCLLRPTFKAKES